MTTYHIRHPCPSNDHKKLINCFVNSNSGVGFTKHFYVTFILKLGGKNNKNVNCKVPSNLATKLTYPSNDHKRFVSTFVNTNCWVVLTICLIITIIVKPGSIEYRRLT